MKRLITSTTEYEAGGETFDGYMGAIGWKGKNVDANLDIKEIAKIIRTQFKKKFPGYKISVRISRFSGGESISANIKIHISDLMPKDEFVSEATYNPFQYVKGYWIGCPRADGTWEDLNRDSFYDMSTEDKEDFFSRYYDYCIKHYSEDKYATINYGHEAIPLLNDAPIAYVKHLMDSFNYDDSNSMVDYFSTNFYGSVSYSYDNQ